MHSVKADGGISNVDPQQRVILIVPAAPGRKGDEGMVLGALELFRTHPIVILNSTPECLWLGALRLSPAARERISEAPGPIREFAARIGPNDLLFFIGADIIDGTCGVEPSLERLDLVAEAIGRKLPVYVSCSFRSQVAPRILEQLFLIQDAEFLIRDHRSLANFQSQTGRAGHIDLSFICCAQTNAIVGSTIATIAMAASEHEPIIGLNFSEQSFRSFFDNHCDENRVLFVRTILHELSSAHPNAFYVLFSNDTRRWLNHLSDDDYQNLAFEWIVKNLGKDCVLTVDPTIDYAGNIAILESVDLLVSGRMHLSLAAFRARTVAIVIMGKGKGYTSIDKMQGAFETYFGTVDGVVSDISQLGVLSTRFHADQKMLENKLSKLQSKLTASITLNAAERLRKTDRRKAMFKKFKSFFVR